jgi:DNA-binding IclR family transcriptional regulator
MILECLSQDQTGRGVTDLANDLGLTKSNTFRLLQSLTLLGYAKHNPDKTYSATLKSWQLGRRILDNLNIRDLAAPELKSLSEQTKEAVYLAVPENLSVVYIDKLDSEKPIRSWNPIGGTAPLHCVGTGKAILAANYATLRSQISGHLSQHTDLTLTSLPVLDVDMSLTARRGFAFDKGEFRDRILSFGAAILLPDGQAIAALGISLPDVNMPQQGPDWFGELVREAAKRVTDNLAHV